MCVKGRRKLSLKFCKVEFHDEKCLCNEGCISKSSARLELLEVRRLQKSSYIAMTKY